MKLTQWEFDRLIDALELEVERARQDGRGIKNLLRLRGKLLAHAEVTGKRRVQA